MTKKCYSIKFIPHWTSGFILWAQKENNKKLEWMCNKSCNKIGDDKFDGSGKADERTISHRNRGINKCKTA